MSGWIAWLSGLALVLASPASGELFSKGLRPVDAGAGAARASSCAGCHSQEHAEWSSSRHGRAWTNAIFQREYRDRPLEWCVHCHAPLREQLDQVRQGGGPFADEGVTCAACHVRDGRMLARTHRPGSPHDTVIRADFGGPAFCAGCHQFNFPVIAPDGRVTRYTEHPMQATVDQHARGPRAARECLTCHASSGAGHAFPGGHDAGMIARALTLSTCRTAGALQVTLQNAGAGHNVPTGDVHRHLVLRAWRASAPERMQEAILGRRFEPADDGGKVAVSDTTIPAGENRTVRFTLADLGAPAPAREPISLALRLVYTIDEFPFRGRELSEATAADMLRQQLRWSELPACPADALPGTAGPRRRPSSRRPAPR